jgi:ferric-dicitrate binding protein FerR (iron transport regulator)
MKTTDHQEYAKIHYQNIESVDSEMNALYEITGSADDLNPNVEDAWSKLGIEEQSKATPRITMLKYAASILILLGVAYIFNFYFNGTVEYIDIAAKDDIERIELPDGSIVLLQKGSQLSYHPKFINQRKLDLKGQAYFEVVKSENPFEIDLNGSSVEVLGTTFNIHQKDDVTEVFVNSGKVLFSYKSQDVILTEKEFAFLNIEENKIYKGVDRENNHLFWMNYELVYENTPLNQIFTDLEKYYEIDISSENSKILNCKISGTFKNKTPDEILTSICAVLDLSFTKNSNNFSIKGKGC